MAQFFLHVADSVITKVADQPAGQFGAVGKAGGLIPVQDLCQEGNRVVDRGVGFRISFRNGRQTIFDADGCQ